MKYVAKLVNGLMAVGSVFATAYGIIWAYSLCVNLPFDSWMFFLTALVIVGCFIVGWDKSK